MIGLPPNQVDAEFQRSNQLCGTGPVCCSLVDVSETSFGSTEGSCRQSGHGSCLVRGRQRQGAAPLGLPAVVRRRPGVSHPEPRTRRLGAFNSTCRADQPASTTWRGPQVPGAPVPRLRPEHTRFVEQVPLPPVPQHVWPSPPQVAHVLLVAPRTHSCGAVHAFTPPSMIGPPVTGQQT